MVRINKNFATLITNILIGSKKKTIQESLNTSSLWFSKLNQSALLLGSMEQNYFSLLIQKESLTEITSKLEIQQFLNAKLWVEPSNRLERSVLDKNAFASTIIENTANVFFNLIDSRLGILQKTILINLNSLLSRHS